MVDVRTHEVVTREQARMDLRFRQARVLGSLLWVAIGVVADLPAPNWSVLSWPAAYCAFAILVLVVGTPAWVPSWTRFFVVPLVDIPIICLGQMRRVLESSEVLGNITFTLSLFALMVVFSSMSLRAAVVVLSGVVAAGAHAFLLHTARPGIDISWYAAAQAVLLVTTLTSIYLSRRVTVLVGSVANLSRHFSPEVARLVSDSRQRLERGETRVVTVLVSDVRGFTQMSEDTPAERVVEQLNEYLAEMVGVIERHHGNVDKFMGDGILAYFGAPQPLPDHAAAGVSCALEMLDVLDRLNRDWLARGKPRFSIGVGLHSGPVVLGEIGPAKRREFTIIGDTVNVASRIEGLTKTVGVPVLVSRTTSFEAPAFDYRACDPLPVKGKSVPLQTFAPSRARPATGS